MILVLDLAAAAGVGKACAIESDETRLDYMILEKILLYQIRLH